MGGVRSPCGREPWGHKATSNAQVTGSLRDSPKRAQATYHVNACVTGYHCLGFYKFVGWQVPRVRGVEGKMASRNFHHSSYGPNQVPSPTLSRRLPPCPLRHLIVEWLGLDNCLTVDFLSPQESCGGFAEQGTSLSIADFWTHIDYLAFRTIMPYLWTCGPRPGNLNFDNSNANTQSPSKWLSWLRCLG